MYIKYSAPRKYATRVYGAETNSVVFFPRYRVMWYIITHTHISAQSGTTGDAKNKGIPKGVFMFLRYI